MGYNPVDCCTVQKSHLYLWSRPERNLVPCCYIAIAINYVDAGQRHHILSPAAQMRGRISLPSSDHGDRREKMKADLRHAYNASNTPTLQTWPCRRALDAGLFSTWFQASTVLAFHELGHFSESPDAKSRPGLSDLWRHRDDERQDISDRHRPIQFASPRRQPGIRLSMRR